MGANSNDNFKDIHASFWWFAEIHGVLRGRVAVNPLTLLDTSGIDRQRLPMKSGPSGASSVEQPGTSGTSSVKQPAPAGPRSKKRKMTKMEKMEKSNREIYDNLCAVQEKTMRGSRNRRMEW